MVLYVPCLGVRFFPVSPVCLAERPPFGKELLIWSTICLFVALVVSHFGFEGRTLVLIASVPGHCLSFTSYSGHNIINRVFRRSSADNSVVSGGNLAEIRTHLSTSLLPARIKKIQSKMKSLEWPQHFSHCKYMGIFFSKRSRAANHST